MSCGDHHDTPCDEVLARVYVYLDGELDESWCGDVKQHLDECGPCLKEYGLEEVVRRLVGKCCGSDPVPADLRGKVLLRIQEARAEIAVTQGETTAGMAAEVQVRVERD